MSSDGNASVGNGEAAEALPEGRNPSHLRSKSYKQLVRERDRLRRDARIVSAQRTHLSSQARLLRRSIRGVEEEIRLAADQYDSAMSDFSHLSDPRSSLSDEHWRILLRLREIESRRGDLINQKKVFEKRLERTVSEQGDIEGLDSSISARLRSCEDRIRLIVEQVHAAQADSGRAGEPADAGEPRRLWVRIIKGPRDADSAQASGSMSSWLRHYMASGQHERVLLLDRFDIAGLYQDLAHLEGDQAELRLDMLVAVLKLLAEERPDVLRRVVEEVLSMAEKSGVGAERLQSLIIELLQGLELDVRARGRREPPPVASA